MLDYAYFHKEELQKQIKKVLVPNVFLGKYKFLHVLPYHNFESFNIEPNSKRWIQFVSITKDGQVVGYFGADIDRDVNAAKEIVVFNLADNSPTFASDFRDFFRKLFGGYNLNKVSFSVVVGAPHEPMYDLYAKKYGGRIVGILKNHIKLIDGKIYDLKMYEVMKETAVKTARDGDLEKTLEYSEQAAVIKTERENAKKTAE